MKKAMLPLLAAFVLIFAGCTGSLPSAQQAQASPVPVESIEPAAAAGKIEPLPAAYTLDALDNCTFPASFQAADVYLNDDGALVVQMTVYDCETFDLVDVSRLAEGGTLVTGGEEMPIESVERSDDGRVLINGGSSNGGCTLATQDNGVYYALGADGAALYRALGETTLPVGQNFTFTDSSEPNGAGKTSYAGDFLTEMETSDTSFSQYGTSVTVQDGFIINIARVCNP
ncbi:MAG TPA: hypothetical protein P5075_11925 [Eubacteriales bacterium]|nr:hypothetical protein [Eubacteriales bacterium]